MQSFFNFLLLVFFSTFNAISCDNIDNNTQENVITKIIGGHPVEDQMEFAFIISLRVKDYHICGGSIINDQYILTAAHCCFDDKNRKYPPKLLSILAGTLLRYSNNNDNAIIKNVEHVIIHEFYDPIQVANDIALIKIVGRFPIWTNHLHPIQLSTKIPYDREMCKVAGWGVTKYNTTRTSYQLLYVEIPIIDKNSCRSYYGNYITTQMICAGGGGKDSCQGDSGGPLICRGVLDGIVSWGDGCGTYPGVYTAISKYLLWIYKNVDSNNTTINYINLYFVLLNLIFVYIVCCYQRL